MTNAGTIVDTDDTYTSIFRNMFNHFLINKYHAVSKTTTDTSCTDTSNTGINETYCEDYIYNENTTSTKKNIKCEFEEQKINSSLNRKFTIRSVKTKKHVYYNKQIRTYIRNSI